MTNNDIIKKANPEDTLGMPFQRVLILWFAFIALISCVSIGILTYSLRYHRLHERVFEQLEATRNDKMRNINLWIKERLNDLHMWSRMPSIIELCERHQAKIEVNAPHDLIQFQLIKQSYDYDAIGIVAPQTGLTFVSTTPEGNGNQILQEPYLGMVFSRRQAVISDVIRRGKDDKPLLLFAGPIHSPTTEEIIGILVFAVDLSTQFYPNIIGREGLGETGETLLVNRDGLVQSPLKYDPDAIGNRIIRAEPARRGASGETGRIAVIDYRDVPVMAAYGYLPVVQWGLVVKQDQSEINTPVVQMAYQVMQVSGVVLLFSIFIGIFIAKMVSQPAVQIAAVADAIGEGHLEVRALETGPREMRKIANSLNRMVEQLSRRFYIDHALSEMYAVSGIQNRVEDLLNQILPQLMEATRSQLGVVYLPESEAGKWRCVVSRGAAPERLHPWIRAHPPDTVLSEAALTGKVTVLPHLPERHDFTLITQAGERCPRSWLTIPLLQYGQVMGVIGLASLYDYREEDLEIAESIRLHLGQSLEVCRANEKTEQLAEELQASNEELKAANEELQTQSEILQQQTAELEEQAAELETQRLQLAEANRIKSEFLSNMSHELRTPLNSVLALSQLMIERGVGKNREQEEEFLHIIERNGRHLLNMINDILDLAKIEAGRVNLVCAEFKPSRVVERAVEVISPLAQEKGLGIEVSEPLAATLYSDEEKVYQILLNLLSNAVKFTDQGKISIQVKSTGETMAFSVQDTGIGILPADLLYIFDEFRQVDGSITRKYGGSGLGLAISQKLAHLLGGEIQVQSVMGQGSTFTLNLPVRGSLFPPVESRKEKPDSLPYSRLETSAGQGRRMILVIDDDETLCRIIQDFLEESGYRVLTAANGKDGIQLARQHHPFAITLDVLMPDMDGWEIIQQLKSTEATHDIPVIIISILEDRGTSAALGAVGYIKKPFDKNQLLVEISKIEKQRKVHRILVVDDDPISLQQIQGILDERGYRIDTADGGEFALQKLYSTPPDVLILDLLMPKVDGFWVLDRLRKEPTLQNIPVIVLTAKDLTTPERLQLENQVYRIILKNRMEKDYLLREIESVLAEIELEQSPDKLKKTPLILIVEDNPDNLTTIRAILESNAYECVPAGDGQEAVELSRRIHPDLILMDIQLPVLSGIEATGRIKADPSLADIPIIALTAKAMREDREKISTAGCDDYLAKPLEPEQVLETVRKWLREPENKS